MSISVAMTVNGKSMSGKVEARTLLGSKASGTPQSTVEVETVMRSR